MSRHFDRMSNTLPPSIACPADQVIGFEFHFSKGGVGGWTLFPGPRSLGQPLPSGSKKKRPKKRGGVRIFFVGPRKFPLVPSGHVKEESLVIVPQWSVSCRCHTRISSLPFPQTFRSSYVVTRSFCYNFAIFYGLDSGRGDSPVPPPPVQAMS